MDRLAGEAPAMGASNMGTFIPYFWQKELARSSERDVVAAMLSI
jgi:hypothetical protein